MAANYWHSVKSQCCWAYHLYGWQKPRSMGNLITGWKMLLVAKAVGCSSHQGLVFVWDFACQALSRVFKREIEWIKNGGSLLDYWVLSKIRDQYHLLLGYLALPNCNSQYQIAIFSIYCSIGTYQINLVFMSVTCQHMLPWCRHCWLKISQTGFMAGSVVGWCVTAQLPSHIHDSCGHYSDGGNGHFLRIKWYVHMN